MKIVFIHGRAQGGRSSQEIRDQWVPGLQRGFTEAGVRLDPAQQIEIPYYGDELDALTERALSFSAEVVARGAPPAGDVDPLTAAMVKRMAERAGLDIQEVCDDEQLEVEKRGPTRWEWVQALARRLEANHPWLGRLVIGKVTRDVKAYIAFDHIQDAVLDRR